MSYDNKTSMPIGGKQVQGGLPADLQVIRFNLANNQWEFVAQAGGEANTGANVGAGTGLVFRDKVGVALNFKSLLQGSNMTVTDNANDITIATLAEINLAANVGAGTGLVFRDKTGVTLNMKSLIAGANITINNNANDIEIVGAAGGTGQWELIENYLEAAATNNTHTLTHTFTNALYSEVVILAQFDCTAAFELRLEVNGVVGTAYRSRGWLADNANLTVIPSAADGFFTIGTTSVFIINGIVMVEIHLTFTPDLTLQSLGGWSKAKNNSTECEYMHHNNDGTWASITSLRLFTSTSTWEDGSRIRTYGIKGT